MADQQTATKPIEEILKHYRPEQGHLIEILHEVQHTYGYISSEHVAAIADYTNLTATAVWGVMTFYAEFRTTPPGHHIVSICAGPACYTRGLYRLVAAAEETLGIRAGTTSDDGQITLMTHHCNGTCELAPVVHIDQTVFPNLTPAQLRKLLAQFKADQPAGRPHQDGQHEGH